MFLITTLLSQLQHGVISDPYLDNSHAIQVFHLNFIMTLKSTGVIYFCKIMGKNYALFCSSHISFNPTSHLKPKGSTQTIDFFS